VADPIPVSAEVTVPASAIRFRATRSAGPGGQNVNKVASKVELRVDLDGIVGLTPEARARLQALCAGRRDREGRLVVTSQRTRDQRRNLDDAREKVREVVARALVLPRPRRPTRVSLGAVEQRLARKRVVSSRKKQRAAVRGDED
jgi:ribosome-associated protein